MPTLDLSHNDTQQQQQNDSGGKRAREDASPTVTGGPPPALLQTCTSIFTSLLIPQQEWTVERLQQCIFCLENHLGLETRPSLVNSERKTDPDTPRLEAASHSMYHVAHSLVLECAATVDTTYRHRNQKKRWELRQELIETVQNMLAVDDDDDDDTRLALVLLVGTVALLHPSDDSSTDTRRFLASALTHGWELPPTNVAAATRQLAHSFLLQLLSHSQQQQQPTESAATASTIDLHIVCMLARTIGWTECHTEAEIALVAWTAQHHQPTDLPAALQLAAQLQPYYYDESSAQHATTTSSSSSTLVAVASAVVSPNELIQTAVSNNLWTAAERIAMRASQRQQQQPTRSSTAATTTNGSPMRTLVTAALEAHMYRLADTYISSGQDDIDDGVPAPLRLAARYLHVCSTLTKLMRKQAWPIIERQVLRVDAAVREWGSSVAMVNDDDDATTTTDTTTIRMDEDDDLPTTFATASTDIRRFALDQLTAQGHVDGAQRLATVWDMPYVYSATELAALIEVKRKTYLQWEELHNVHQSIAAPELIQDPVVLREQFAGLLAVDTAGSSISDQQQAIIGFDAEWDDEGTGVAILQLASNGGAVLLLDIVQLSATPEGSAALCDTVGALLFADSAFVKVGFACGQDIQRLRSTRMLSLGEQKLQQEHGMLQKGVQNVMDLKKLVPGQGLSRCCQKFLGKPLDKAEQCSQWTRRPLSIQQRTYAALDALTCAVIYSQLVDNHRESDAEQIH